MARCPDITGNVYSSASRTLLSSLIAILIGTLDNRPLINPGTPSNTALMLELIIVCFLHKSQTHDYKLQHESSIDGAQGLIERWLSSVPMSIAMSEESSVREAEE